MSSTQEIVTLLSYVLSEKDRAVVATSGLAAVPKERRLAALRGLQDLGWVGHSGLADYEESYSLTREGRRIAEERPSVDALDPRVRNHLAAISSALDHDIQKRRDGLMDLIRMECDMGNWDSALIYCYELKKIAEFARDTPTSAFALFYKGRIDRAQNRWDEALESYLTALEMYMECGDRKGVCETNRAMGIVYGAKGDHAAAIRCFESSLSLAREIQDRDAEAKAEANLAVVFDLEGKTDEAERASKHCLEYFLEVGDLPNAVRTSNNLGVLYLSRDLFDSAAEYFEKTIAACRQMANREVLGAALVNAGYCYARTGQLSRSIAYTDEAVSIFKEANNLNMLALAYRNYGAIEFRSSRHDVGSEWFEKSVRAAKASGVEDTLAACCYEYGINLMKATLNLNMAERLVKKASQLYKKLGNLERARAIETRLHAL